MMLAVVVAGVVALVFPQTGRAAAVEVSAWTRAHPLLAAVGRPFGATHVFTSWWFLTAAALLFVNGSLCLIEQVEKSAKLGHKGGLTISARMIRPTERRRVATVGLDSEAALSLVSDELASAGLRVRKGTRGGEPALLAAANAWSQWATVLFHSSLLVVLAAILMVSLTQANGSFRVVVGGDFIDRPGAYGRYSKGVFGPDSLGGWRLSLSKLQPRYKRAGFNPGPASSFAVTTADGRTNRVIALTKGAEFNVDGTTIFQTSSWGFAPILEIAVGSQPAKKGAAMLHERSGRLPSGEFDVGGPLVGLVDMAEPADSASARPRLNVAIRSGRRPALSAVLGYGETAHGDGVSVRYAGFTYWSEFTVVRNSWLVVAEIGFWLAVVGLSGMYFWPSTYAWALARSEGGRTAVYVGGRREKFSEDFRDLVGNVERDLETRDKETQ